MTNNSNLGNLGEDYTVAYLINKGYKILERNWTYGHKEIDVIAEMNGYLVFFEIKTRQSTIYGNPEEAVSKKKICMVKKAAEQYIYGKTYQMVRFDVIAIVIENGGISDFLHLEDAFY